MGHIVKKITENITTYMYEMFIFNDLLRKVQKKLPDLSWTMQQLKSMIHSCGKKIHFEMFFTNRNEGNSLFNTNIFSYQRVRWKTKPMHFA